MLTTVRRSTTAALLVLGAVLVAGPTGGLVVERDAMASAHAKKSPAKKSPGKARSRAKRCRTVRRTRRPRTLRQRTRPQRTRRQRTRRARRRCIPRRSRKRAKPFWWARPYASPPPIGPSDVIAPLPLWASARLFARTSVWNAPLPDQAPLDPNSASLAAALAKEVWKEMDGRYGPWINTNAYSVPVYTVGADVPKVRVTLDAWSPELQRDFDRVPIPPGAKAAGGSDRHLTIYQPATDTMWDFWLAEQRLDGWHARWGGKMTNASTNPGHFPGSYGATATSIPLAAGLITIEELRSGEINHALAIGIPNTAAGRFTFPAQRTDGRGSGPDAIPEGTRFRIAPSVNLSKLGLSPVGLMIARAAQRYGMIVRDTAGCVVFTAEDPVAAGGDPYAEIFRGGYPSDLLRGFPWDNLQVVAPPTR